MDNTDIPPGDFDGLRAAIVARHTTLPKRLAQVARYALDNPDRMALSTVAELATASGVQPSTLVRFAQGFGYTGFTALQQVFRCRLRDGWPDYRTRLNRVRSETVTEPGRIFDRCVETAALSVNDLLRSVRAAEFDDAAALLADAAHVFIIGQRRAFPVAAYLAYSLGKLEFRTTLIDNLGSMADVQSGQIGPGDVLVAISFNPYTPLTIEIAALARAHGGAVIAITDSAFSPLSDGAQVRLEVTEADFGAFRSLSATMALAMALAIAGAERRASA
jgi:DNA-binding MurR/RpiR family transcriptional regulator